MDKTDYIKERPSRADQKLLGTIISINMLRKTRGKQREAGANLP